NLLKQALALDPQRFTLFPLDRLEPHQILAAGPAGVTFLCKHQFLNAQVVVKALSLPAGDPALERLFAHAQALKQLDHPAVIRVHDCAFADPAHKTRAYLVTDYFEGLSLEEFVKTDRPLAAAEAVLVARQLAEGLQTAHACGLFHGAVTPATVLVRKIPPEP